MSKAATTIQNGRGYVITNFATIEMMMSQVIARNYSGTKEKEQALLSDVLYHQYFSFELKRSLFEKILKYNNPEQLKSPHSRKLRKMQEIRNMAAHAIIRVKLGEDRDDINSIVFDFRGKEHQANKILEKYDELRASVEPLIRELSANKVTKKTELGEWLNNA